jgi:proline iminopeptidase
MPEFPVLEPYATGMLDVGQDQRLYWETCGNPNGTPALVLHGGPGSGCTRNYCRYFDPTVYRIVLFDQRGCGRSLDINRASASGACSTEKRRGAIGFRSIVFS